MNLYVGKGFKKLSSQINHDDFFIASAGLGLIQSTELVPSYSLTISPGHEVSIQNFIAEKIDPSDWWEKVVTSDFSIPHLSQLADESDLLCESNFAICAYVIQPTSRIGAQSNDFLLVTILF